MRHDPAVHWFRSPRGRPVAAWVREGTSDWNTMSSCLDHDEYGLAAETLSGPCLDVGAHIGGAALALLVDNPDATVTCVEPLPENVALLRRNLELNRVSDRATVVQGAAGRGTVDISYAFEGGENELHHAWIGNANCVPQGAAPHRAVTYRGWTLAELLAGQDCPWAKVDCEGGEWSLLDDPAVALVRVLRAEWHPTVLADGSTGSPERIRALLEPTHTVTVTGPEGGPGGVHAVRR